MSENKVPANRHPEILVSENAVKKGMYALLLTERQFTNRENTAYSDNVYVQYYSQRDFKSFQRYQMERKFLSVEIVHDPTLPVAKQAEAPQPAQVEQPEPTSQVNKGGRPRKVQ